VLVRFFAAAHAAAGVEEERHELGDGATLDELLTAVLAVDRSEPPAGAPPLARVIARSSFLRNEVAVRDRAAVLSSDDVVDVLPPFAGG
jgi:molybdopterin synthase sulfur carrier subunit